MLNLDPIRLLQALLLLPIFLFSLTVHEFAHAWTARYMGDPTAELEGRLTLDPRPHIDPAGLLMYLLSAFVGFGIGWAKPVPIQLGHCRKPLVALFWIAAAGPISNVLQAAAAVVLLALLHLAGTPDVGEAIGSGRLLLFGSAPLGPGMLLAALLGAYLELNIVLALFNLLPIPPLDGGRIAVSLLPFRLAQPLARIEPYGIFVLLVLMYAGLVGWWIETPLSFVLTSLARLFGAG